MKKFGGRWATEIPTVLWSLRTTPNWTTGFTPFFIVYRSEVVLPTDLDYGSPRIRAYNESGARTSLKDVTDQLDETCDVALLRSARYQLALRMYHGHQHSTLAIWCSGSSKATRIITNSPRHGMGRTPSWRCLDQAPTRCRPPTTRSSPTHRTSSSYVVSTLSFLTLRAHLGHSLVPAPFVCE